MEAFTSISSGWIWVGVAALGILWVLYDYFFGVPRQESPSERAGATVERMKIRYAFWGSENGCALAAFIGFMFLALVFMTVLLIYELAK